MHKLNNNWTLWLHLPQDIDWSIASYKKVLSFDTLEDGIGLIENINKELVEKCMLFIMKDNIKPIWEDPDNSKGGCLSYKINVEYVYEVWKKLSYYLIGGSLFDNAVLKEHDIFQCLENNDNVENTNCKNQNDTSNNEIQERAPNDPLNIDKLCDIEPQHCLYKKHEILY